MQTPNPLNITDDPFLNIAYSNLVPKKQDYPAYQERLAICLGAMFKRHERITVELIMELITNLTLFTLIQKHDTILRIGGESCLPRSIIIGVKELFLQAAQFGFEDPDFRNQETINELFFQIDNKILKPNMIDDVTNYMEHLIPRNI